MEVQGNIVLFDGVCNFCNSTVQFIIRKEKKPELRFASLQSATGQELIKKYKVDQSGAGSFVYIKDGKAYTKSSAALRLTARFKGIWPIMQVFLSVPPFIRNAVYDFISRNRYKWWGRSESCQLPSPELRIRFLDL